MDPQLKVLCVDDNQDAAQVVAHLLQGAGCDVRVCNDGEAALLLAGEYCPDVCVLDIRMPDMDGNELVHRLKAQAGDRPLRCIALTGLWDIAAQHETHNAGFDEHLVKPVELQRLVEAVTGQEAAAGG